MWTLNPSERLRYWYNFRQQLNDIPFDQALHQTVNLWSFAPFVSKYLHYEDICNWPDPWQLIYENNYCDLAKALGMLYTLHFCNHRPLLEIRIYYDSNAMVQYNLVWINKGKYVLNYEFNDIVNKEHVEKEISLLKKITIQDLDITKIE